MICSFLKTFEVWRILISTFIRNTGLLTGMLIYLMYSLQVDAGLHGRLCFPLHVAEQHLHSGHGDADSRGCDAAGHECKEPG